MNCRITFDELMALLDGEVPEQRAAELLRHVEGCPDCRRVMASQSGLETAWRESFRYPEPERFREMEEKTAWRMGTAARHRPRLAVLLPAAAAAAAVLLGVKLILFDGPPLPSVSPFPGEYRNQQEEIDGAAAAQPPDASEQQAPEEQIETESEVSGLDEAGAAAGQVTGMESTIGGADAQSYNREQGLSGDSGPSPVELNLFESFGADPGFTAQGYMIANTGTVLGAGEGQDDIRSVSSPMDAGTTEGSGGIAGIDGLQAGGGGCGSVSGTTLSASGLGGAAILPDETLSTSEPGSVFLERDGDVESGEEVRSQTMDQESATTDTSLLESWWDRLEQEDGVDITAGDEISGPETAGLLSVSEQDQLPAFTSATVEGCPPENLWHSATLHLVFDPLGMPDSATALLLDSLFPDWSLYIPFAFRDTVLIATPGEVRLRLTGESQPAEAE